MSMEGSEQPPCVGVNKPDCPPRELANLSHEVTRGIIAGQIKALSLIVAIEVEVRRHDTDSRPRLFTRRNRYDVAGFPSPDFPNRRDNLYQQSAIGIRSI
jgi:hypothetical protein